MSDSEQVRPIREPKPPCDREHDSYKEAVLRIRGDGPYDADGASVEVLHLCTSCGFRRGGEAAWLAMEFALWGAAQAFGVAPEGVSYEPDRRRRRA